MFAKAVGAETFISTDHSWVYTISYVKPWMKTITILKVQVTCILLAVIVSVSRRGYIQNRGQKVKFRIKKGECVSW